jgi:predicted lipoprotein with Yx(FWY)xxD motif
MTGSMSSRLTRLVTWSVCVVGALGLMATANAATRRAVHRGPAVLVRIEKTKLGPVLADAAGRTLYYFSPDHPPHLACNGKCLKVWPPLIVPASFKVAPTLKGVPGRFSVVLRGKERQLAWDGHPLYTFVSDKKPGEVNGQGFLKKWWAVLLKAGAAKGGAAKSASGASSGGW